jgi:hypothetical protein
MDNTPTFPSIEVIHQLSALIAHVEHVLLVAVDGRQYEVTIENLDGDLSVVDVEPAGTHPALQFADTTELEDVAEELQIAEDADALRDLPSHFLEELLRVC